MGSGLLRENGLRQKLLYQPVEFGWDEG